MKTGIRTAMILVLLLTLQITPAGAASSEQEGPAAETIASERDMSASELYEKGIEAAQSDDPETAVLYFEQAAG